jgi:hypothetical protein
MDGSNTEASRDAEDPRTVRAGVKGTYV